MSLVLLGGVALTLAPLARAEAAPAGLGMRLRTILTLTPDGPAADEVDAAAGADAAEPEAPAGAAAAEPAVVLPEGPPPPPADPEPSKGLGLLISGAVVTGAVGLPLTLWGTAVIVASRDPDDDIASQVGAALGRVAGGALVFFGVVGLGVGVPLLAVGGHRFSRWRDWEARQRLSLTPSAGLSAHGTITPGLTLRF